MLCRARLSPLFATAASETGRRHDRRDPGRMPYPLPFAALCCTTWRGTEAKDKANGGR